MRVGCPSCLAEFSLDTLLMCEASREPVAKLAEISLPFGALAMRYLALFRPAKRRLSHERVAALILEMLPDVQRQAITRKGRDWDCPLDTWKLGLEAVLAARDKGSLTLPLTSHGYLYEILAAMADKHEARVERQTEADKRNFRPAGAVAPAALAGDLVAPMVLATVPPVPVRSLAAERIRAEIAAKKALREQAAETPNPETGDA